MLPRSELDRLINQRALALKTAMPPPPGYSAAAAANEYAGAQEEIAEAERRRRRVQHRVDPYLGPDEDDDTAGAEAVKRFTQAYEPPADYLEPGRVDPRMFRREGPVSVGHAACSTGYEPPVASWAPSPSLRVRVAARPVMADGWPGRGHDRADRVVLMSSRTVP